jgi:peptidoglycan/xylan/chitin deacetylase (PgdA/CDA1 family)
VIRAAIGRLRRRDRQPAPRSGSALILLYHRVAKVRSDPWDLAVGPRRFEEHLEVLRREACPLRLEQLSKALVGGELPERAVVVTFDDGYADNLYNARPLLERYEVPATIFLPSGLIGGEGEFWWDELERLLLLPGKLPGTLYLNISGHAHRWQLDEATRYPRADFLRNRRWRAWEVPPSPRHSLYKSLWDLLHRLGDEEQRRVLIEIRRWAGVDEEGRPSHRLLSLEETSALAEGDLVEIGAHTVNHPSLSSLSLDLQRNEILESKVTLENIVGSPVTSFAYPYGKRSDYSARTVALVREAGFTYACSNVPGVVTQSTDRFQLPRIQAHNWDGETFWKHLQEWFDG